MADDDKKYGGSEPQETCGDQERDPIDQARQHERGENERLHAVGQASAEPGHAVGGGHGEERRPRDRENGDLYRVPRRDMYLLRDDGIDETGIPLQRESRWGK